jgi:hypothetical protein
MNEVIATLIAVGSLIVFMLITWGIMSLIYHIKEKREWARWSEAVATDESLQFLLTETGNLYRIWHDKDANASGYRKQIDSLLCNIHYDPIYIKEYKEHQAEIYKKLYFDAKNEADASWSEYCKVNSELNEYCKVHKLKRMT